MQSLRHWNRNFLFFIFALSGFAGLIYESIWSHYLKLFLGHAAYSQVLVLGIFMGGMAIGAWAVSKCARRINHLFWYYALAELVLGLFAFGFHWAYTSVTTLSYDTVMPMLGSPAWVMAYKWGVSALIILPQSILLGTTFPLMSNAIIRRFPEMPSFDIAMLYFTNSFGAAIGVLVSGFVLLSWVGLPGTMTIVGVINLAVVALTIVATVFIRYKEDQQRSVVSDSTQPEAAPSIYRFMLLAAGITGAASFMYEIGWIRLLSMVLGSSTHAFELMLSAFILGIALGGFWVRKRIDTLKSPIAFLAVVQLVMGALALCTVLGYDQTYSLMAFFMKAVAKSEPGYFLFNTYSQFIAMLVMIPVTFCAGMTLPLMTSMLLKKGFGEKSVGGVYAANTLGSIIGIAIAVQVIMPMYSLKAVIVSGAALDIILAIALTLWLKGRFFIPVLNYPGASANRGIGMIVSSALGLSMLVWIGGFYQLDPNRMISGVYRGGSAIANIGSDILYMRDGKSSTVTVTKTPRNYYVIATNGKPDASIDRTPNSVTMDEPTQVLMAALPMSIYPSSKTAAVIGFGSGITAAIMLDSPAVERMDVVEIEPAMVEGARLFHPRNNKVYNDARSHIYYDDAKAFFSTYQRQYDLIISEPSNPWVSGVSGLFSKEFYQMTAKHLTQDGLFVQWLNTYEMNMDLIVTVLKAVNEVFPYYAMYSTSNTDIILIAKSNAPVGTPVDTLFKTQAINQSLKTIGVESVDDLKLRRVATEQLLRPYSKLFATPANSDYYPYLDLNAVKARFLKANVTNFNNVGFVAPITMLESDSPRLEITEVSKNIGYAREELARRALDVFKGVTQYSQFAEVDDVPKAVRPVVSLLAPKVKRCIGIPEEGRWYNALLVAGSVMSNYLSEKDLEKTYAIIAQRSCVSQMTLKNQQLFSFFEAVGKRDAAQMSKIGITMLSDTPDLNKKTQAYFLTMTMLGFLADEHYQSAAMAWKKFGPRIYKNEVPTGSIHVILAYTQAHLKKG